MFKKYNKAFRQGISFGIISSVITVIGLSLGMWSSEGNLKMIIASIIGLSISNSFADGFSMYLSNKARNDSETHSRISAIITVVIEFFLPFLFLIPFFLFKLQTAIIINIIISMSIVSLMGYYISKLNKDNFKKIYKNIIIYCLIMLVIIFCTYSGGKIVNMIL